MKRLLLLALLLVGARSAFGTHGYNITAYGLTPNTTYASGTWQWTTTKQSVYSCNPSNTEFFCTFTGTQTNVTVSSPAFTTDGSGNASSSTAPSGSVSGCAKWNGSSTGSGTSHASFSGYTECQGQTPATETWVFGVSPATCAWTFDVALSRTCAGDGVAHTVEAKVGSTVVGGGEWPHDVTNFTGEFSGTNAQGEIVSLWIDGVQMGTGHDVACSGDPPPGNAFVLNGTFGTACVTPTPDPVTPTPTPPPDPTPTPAPTPPATPAPSATPASTPPPAATPVVDPVLPPGSGGGNPPPNPPMGTPPPGGMNVNVANPADFYAPMKEAIEQAQSNVAPPPDAGNTGGSMGNGVAPVQEPLERGKLDEIEGETTAIVEAKNSIIDEVRAKMDAQLDVVNTLPTALGTVTSIPFPLNNFNTIAQMGLPSTIQLGPWMNGISLVRLVLLWILRTCFWVKVIQIFASQGATTKVVN